MSWSDAGNHRRLAAVLGCMLLAGACQSGVGEGFAPVDRVSHVVGTTLSGPDSITSSGSYQYHATYSGVYPNYTWWSRTCNTQSVTSCTTTWTQSWSATSDGGTGQLNSFSETFNGECPVPKFWPSFQVRVIGQGFGQPPDTAYKVTRTCSILQ